ncbi:MAG: PHP domain-containing protein [Microbacteriaceae bacterium]
MSLLTGDFHVHSTFSDDAVSTLAENIAAASAAGLSQLRLIDHVRESTTWVPEFVAAVAAERVPDELQILTGVEAKLRDQSGAVDIPLGLTGVDSIVIADHQFPGTDAPWSPSETVRRLADGLSTDDALDLLITGLVNAMHRYDNAQLAHCFSILPKVGLSEDDLSEEHLRAWARAAASTHTLIEVNEKWACPSPRSLAAAASAGATIVASTDAHVATDVGVYDRVRQLAEQAGLL